MSKCFAVTALIAALALPMFSCGRPLPIGQAELTTALRQEAPSRPAPASKKAAVPAEAAGEPATGPVPTASPSAAAGQQTTATHSIRPEATTQVPATTVTATAAVTAPPRPFGGAQIVLAGPGRSIDEALSQSPHKVYAVDSGGRRFLFQPQAYTGAGFFVDVHLDNRDGSYTRIETFACAALGVDGKYSIVLVTPDSTTTRDERQNLTLVENVCRFELDPAAGRYSARLQAAHVPYPMTAYYALDTARVGGFVRFTP